MTTFLLQFDGGSRGNPGIGGSGSVLYQRVLNQPAEEIWSDFYYLGPYCTNNQAEYTGLLRGLEEVVRRGIQRLHVQGDSLLVIRQMQGKYQCRATILQELYQQCLVFTQHIPFITFEHIPRSLNVRADMLSNQGMDQKEKHS